MNPVELSVIIVNYNVKYFLEHCLLSVKRACESLETEIIVFDNNSTDGSRDYLESRFNKVRFIWSDENIGFAKANNRALALCRGKYILFLNPDTIIAEDTIVICLRHIQENISCGALGVKMIDGSGKYLPESKRSFPSPWNAFWRLTGLDKLLPNTGLTSGYYASSVKRNETSVVDVLPGAFLMMKKEVFEEVKGFDESYFMFGEDIDICYRLKKAGYHNFYFPQTTVIHFKGESTQKQSPSYVRNFYGAMHLFVHKHYSLPKALLMHGAISAGKILSGIKYQFLHQNSHSDKSVRTAIIASQDRFKEVANILKNNVQPSVIIGRISPAIDDKEHSLGNVNDVQGVINNNQLKQLIFCEGEISNKSIIELMQLLNGTSTFLFHENGAQSIIGSHHKNHTGFFIRSS